MISMTLMSFLFGLVGFIGVVAAAIFVVKASSTKTTIEQQKVLIDTQKENYNALTTKLDTVQEKYEVTSKDVSELQGQVKVLKDIPLGQISGDLGKLAGHMETISDRQHDIIRILKPTGRTRNPNAS